jgi:hypothetical protein
MDSVARQCTKLTKLAKASNPRTTALLDIWTWENGEGRRTRTSEAEERKKEEKTSAKFQDGVELQPLSSTATDGDELLASPPIPAR